MAIIKRCPNCGNEINEVDVEFCTECGSSLTIDPVRIQSENSSNGFFDNLTEKTSFPVIAFSFVIFGIFLFIGAFIWSLFMAGGKIDLITYLLLVTVFSTFFGSIFVGFFGVKDKSYVIPNFSVYLASVFAFILCEFGLIFTFLMGIMSLLSSIPLFGSSSPSLGSSYQSTTPDYTAFMDLSIVLKLILFILLIPVAAYLGVYLGYFLRNM